MSNDQKKRIQNMVELRLGSNTQITENEWQTALDFTLKDIYANKFCMDQTADPGYFRHTMANSIVILKQRLLN